MPNAGHLLDLFNAWTPDDAIRRRILVDNPARLYGFSALSRYGGQMYPAPLGFLKQPTDSGRKNFGR